MTSYASTASSTPQSIAGSMLSVVSEAPTLSESPVVGDELSLAEREARLAALLAQSETAHAELSERMRDVYERQGEKLTMLRIMEKTLSSQAGSLLKRLQSEEQSTSQLSGIIKRYKSEHKKLLAKIANPKWEIAHHYHMTCIEHQLGHRQPHVLDVAELLPGHLRIYSLARVSSLYKRALMYYSAKSKADRNSVSESIQESYKRLREVRKDMKEIQRMMDLMKVHMKKQSEERGDRRAAAAAAAAAAAGNTSDMETSDAPPAAAAAAASPVISRRPPSAGGPGGGGGPGGMDAMMRQRRRMLGLGMGGPGGPGASSRSTGPGIGSRGESAASASAAAAAAHSLPSDASTDHDTVNSSSSSSSTAFTTSPSSAASAAAAQASSQSNYRMKYFKTLNLAPKLDFLSSHLPASSPAEQRKDMAESYNMDMKGIHALLTGLEATGKASKEKAQQLTMLQQYRKRMGVESLPQPHFDALAGGTGSGALDTPQSPAGIGGDDSDSEAPERGMSSPMNLPGGPSPYGSPSSTPRMIDTATSSPSSSSSDHHAFTTDGFTLEAPATGPFANLSLSSSAFTTPSSSAPSSAPGTPTASAPSTPRRVSRGGGEEEQDQMSGVARSRAERSLSAESSAADAASSQPSSSAPRRERPRRPSAPAAPPAVAAAPPVTLFSSRSGGGAKTTGSSNASASGSGGDAGGPRAHSSRALASASTLHATDRTTEENGH